MPRAGEMVYKDPDAELFYGMDWSEWLTTGATIAVSAWTITGPDDALTSANASVVEGSLATQVQLLGGTNEQIYTVTNRITTNETIPQIDDRSFFIRVHER